MSHKFIRFEGKDCLDNVLSETKIPTDFDLLSIDIDGNDYHIWESLKKYNPKVVVIEFNPTIPSDIEFVQKPDFKINQGCSLLSLFKLGKIKGYDLIATTICNAIFVRNEYFKLFNITDNSINKMWDTEKPAPRIFQLYDGTVILTEELNLIWKYIKIKKNDLQKVPKFLRYFNDSSSKKSYFIRLLNYIYFKYQNRK